MITGIESWEKAPTRAPARQRGRELTNVAARESVSRSRSNSGSVDVSSCAQCVVSNDASTRRAMPPLPLAGAQGGGGGGGGVAAGGNSGKRRGAAEAAAP